MSAAKIILLDPLTYLKGSFRHYHFVRDWSGARLPADVCLSPLDLMYAAAYLRKHGHQVKIIEASVRHIPNRRLAEIVKKENPDFVLIPSINFGIEGDKHLAGLIRKAVPSVKIIFSGALATYDPGTVLFDGSADFVALGELELPLLNILNGDYRENVAYLDAKNGLVIGKRKLLDLQDLPLPARDLVDNHAYRYAIFNKRNPVTAMTISRGCSHSRCEFCHTNLYTLGRIRYRDLKAVTGEIGEAAFKYGIGEIFFRDQVFTANREFVLALCRFMISDKIGISWRAETRVDLVDREMLELMHRAGCYQLSFGFESCSQESLDLNKKGIKLEQSRQAAKLAREAGIEVVGLFLYGMPGSTKESMDRLSRFALDLKVNYANFEAIYFMPGSPIYEKMLIDSGAGPFPEKRLRAYVRNAYAKFYLRPAFLRRQLFKMIREISPNRIRMSLKVALEAFLFFLSLNSSPFGMFSKGRKNRRG